MASEECDVAVIGGGIAGLNASIVLARNNVRCVCFEKVAPGGLLMNLGELAHCAGLTDTTTGPDFAAALLNTAMELGVELAYEEVSSIDPGTPCRVTTSTGSTQATSVIVATGLTHGLLGVQREEQYLGRGISHCATCDGPLFTNEPVTVVGYDEWAVQETLELASVAAHVDLVVPHTELACLPQQRHALQELDTVRIWYGYQVTDLQADAAGATLAGVNVKSLAGATTTVPTRAVFPYTGRRANVDSLIENLAHDDSGYVRTDLQLRTSVPNIILAGDVRFASPGYLLTAAADGLRAGVTALQQVT